MGLGGNEPGENEKLSLMELSISWVKETEESRMVLEFSDLGEYLYYSLKKKH